MSTIKLSALARDLGGSLEFPIGCDQSDLDIKEVSHSSLDVPVGGLFAAITGKVNDGHDFAAEAVKNGAAALLVERPVNVRAPQILVEDVASVLGVAASKIFGDPSNKLKIIGVTGTSGKTTVVQYLKQMLDYFGFKSVSLGTLEGRRTTPEAPDLQRWLARQVKAAVDVVCMEVSSHGLELGRVNGVTFNLGIFLNLSPEHLDFHSDMESYFSAKKQLFDGRSTTALVNLENDWGRRLESELSPAMPTISFSLKDFSDVSSDFNGLKFRWRGFEVATRMVGRFNLENLAAAAVAASQIGLSDAEIAESMEGLVQVPGRMQLVSHDESDISVIVDYAHKPEALEAALRAISGITDGRIWAVFGAGGDRDKGKRPLMGEIASELADFVIITSDNPRFENPEVIAEEIAGNIEEFAVELDRDTAIGSAISKAKPGDAVLIAGKGHEKVQIFGSSELPFDDVAIAQKNLYLRKAAKGKRS